MKHIKRFSEDIKVPIELGDTILGGKFKNRKTVVKKISKNKKGDITVNDKPLLKYRIVKESISQEDIDNGLAYLKDDGFQVSKLNFGYRDMIQIYKLKKNESGNTNYGTMAMDNMMEVNWSDIESDLLPFIELNKDFIKEIIVTMPIDSHCTRTKAYDREVLSPDKILDGVTFKKVINTTIVLKK
jgi:hypothetical protein